MKIHGSPALAVLTSGWFFARRSAIFFSRSVRIQICSVRESLNFLLNGLVFVLIGLQLPAIRSSIQGYSLSTLLLNSDIFTVLLILLRSRRTFP